MERVSISSNNKAIRMAGRGRAFGRGGFSRSGGGGIKILPCLFA